MSDRPTPRQILASLPKGDAFRWVDLGSEGVERLAEHGYVIVHHNDEAAIFQLAVDAGIIRRRGGAS